MEHCSWWKPSLRRECFYNMNYHGSILLSQLACLQLSYRSVIVLGWATMALGVICKKWTKALFITRGKGSLHVMLCGDITLLQFTHTHTGKITPPVRGHLLLDAMEGPAEPSKVCHKTNTMLQYTSKGICFFLVIVLTLGCYVDSIQYPHDTRPPSLSN